MTETASLHPTDFPSFTTLALETIEPSLRALLSRHREKLTTLLNTHSSFTWETLSDPLAEMDNELHRFWAPIAHLHGVKETEVLRAVYNLCIPLLSEYHTERMQNEALFKAIQSIKLDIRFDALNAARQKVITNDLRDFHLSGVDLPPEKKIRFASLQKELSLLSTRFSENVLDATQGFSIHITDVAQLQGLPNETIQLAEQYAHDRDKSGWVLTLDAPCFTSVMKYLDDRLLRQQLYTAYVTRASDQGPQAGKWDNTFIMDEMVKKRSELAELVGFESYAHFALATRMAKTPEEVLSFLNDLVKRAKPFAEQEVKKLQQFAKKSGFNGSLEPWDIAYYSEKLQQKLFSISDEEVRPYFQAERVLDGMFAVMGKLFGIRLVQHKNIDVWHPDVRFFEVLDANDNLRGYLYTDLYARPHKRGGAWMDECQSRLRLANGQLQYPIAFLTCNFMPPVAGNPSLLTHDDVQTLFHEFGHCLHHLLTQVEEAGVSGISGVPWDAVEFPSQFFEHWSWNFHTLQSISSHVETGEPIPKDLFDKLLAARHFQSGLQMVRQLEFSLFDFRLHLETTFKDDHSVQRILDEVRKDVAVLPVSPFNRFQHSFSHIFAGGYAAGYYSYKWAEVLSSDAFSLFEEKGIFDAATGRSFLENILEQGGVYDPMSLFIQFRHRKPEIQALLRHLGLDHPVTA